ncbi:2-isopropylmalate synthase [Rhodococcus sp. NPDC058521]|uniref:2-isopropylmalate synthase n=1 Tax=Rhodococcus sp. NPDC058521 TaxID=3346536 RepID=UPI00364FA060
MGATMMSVFTAARTDLIERTYRSIDGIRNAVVHMYTATAPTWRSVVLGLDRNSLRQLIFDAADTVAKEAGGTPGRRFEFSPEVFNLTEPDFVLEVCNGLTELWDADADRPVIHNLPATVEVATPNVYADQIEYMDRHLSRRDAVILSVHPHNDRGTGIACAELAVLAGAQRVEGCLFGNGERTGNVDLATLALNLHAQGVDPMIDFTDIDDVRRTVEYCNGIPVHPRHPYAGDLVFTAFSGTHQDAIKKGFADHRRSASAARISPESAPWSVPYLPIDPTDVGRDYEAVIRINSQSGKGGVAHVLSSTYGLDIPRELQIDFAKHVQHQADTSGLELTADELWTLFSSIYGYDGGIRRWSLEHVQSGDRLAVVFDVNGREVHGEEVASGPVDAFVRILESVGIELEVQSFTQHSHAIHDEQTAITLLECRTEGRTVWGMAEHRSVTASAIRAVYAAATSAYRCRPTRELQR